MAPLVMDGATKHAVAVVVTKRPWLATHVATMMAWQTTRPSRVVICTAIAEYDVTPICEALPGIPVDLVVIEQAMVLGALRNAAMTAASDRSGDDAILCSIDDDDCYGYRYLEGIIDGWRRHPHALILGRACWDTLTVSSSPGAPPPQSIASHGGPLSGVAGATISVPAVVWRRRTDLRYPEIGCGEDIALLDLARKQRGVVSAYFGDFTALRWTTEQHQHTSNNQGLKPALPQRFVVPVAGHRRIGR